VRAKILNSKVIAVVLFLLGAMVILPFSPIAPPRVKATNCGDSITVPWSPASGVGVFLFIQACGFNPSPGFTSSFHNVTAWTNSTNIKAISSDFYFEGDPYPCGTPTTCKAVYFHDMNTKSGVFPVKTATFTPSKQLGCVITNVQSFTVQYTVTGLNHTFSNSAQDTAPGACTA
jgi:hypothetical protein